MAGAVGGELATLQALKTDLDASASEAADVKTRLTRTLSSAVWTGPNADQFRQAWAEFSPTFDRLQNALADASASVKAQHNNLAAATGAAERI